MPLRMSSLSKEIQKASEDGDLQIVINHPEVEGMAFFITYASPVYLDRNDNIYYNEADLPKKGEFTKVFLLE